MDAWLTWHCFHWHCCWLHFLDVTYLLVFDVKAISSGGKKDTRTDLCIFIVLLYTGYWFRTIDLMCKFDQIPHMSRALQKYTVTVVVAVQIGSFSVISGIYLACTFKVNEHNKIEWWQMQCKIHNNENASKKIVVNVGESPAEAGRMILVISCVLFSRPKINFYTDEFIIQVSDIKDWSTAHHNLELKKHIFDTSLKKITFRKQQPVYLKAFKGEFGFVVLV